MSVTLTRRALLGCGLAATFMSAPGYAAAPASRKLVVIVARGGMDGMSLAPPIGDPDYVRLRGEIAIPAEAALKLDAAFGLHPALPNFYRMIGAGHGRIAPTAAIPARLRSHFDAQDVLETGAARLYGASTGWLNRALLAGGGSPVKALSIGAQTPLILRGTVQAQSWSPGAGLPQSSDRLVSTLQDLYAADPLLGPAFASGLQTEMMADALNAGAPMPAKDVRGFAVAAARFLTAAQGPQVAVLSLDGFDTHAKQGAVDGQLAQRFRILDDVLAGLETGLGPAWNETVVVLATEFGRTARVNGTGGTDHGAASSMVIAGGALKRGGMLGDWPGLSDGELFEARDLRPTLDVRSVFKALLIEHLGLDRRRVETQVFPQSADAPAVTGLV